MNYSDEVKLTIRDLNNLSKAFSSASNDFYGDKAMINTQLMLLKNNNFGLDSTDIIYNDISKVMKDFDSLVHKLKQMSSDLEVASKSYKDADNSFERKVNGVLYTSMNEVMDLGEDLWEKYKETPEKGAAFMGAAFDSAKDMTLGMFNLVIYGLYMKAHPLEYGKELYRETCEVYKCFKNPKKIIDNLGSFGEALLGINDKEIKNAAIHGDNYTIQKSTYLASINATLMVDTGAGLLGKFGKVGKAAEVEQNISKVSKLESVSNKISVFAKDIPSIGDKLASFREFLANKLRSVTMEIPNPQLVRDSMGNTYMIWAKKVESSGGEIVKSEKVVNGVGKATNVEKGFVSDSYLYQKYKESLVKDDVLNNFEEIITGDKFGDKKLIAELTKDGSNIEEWSKMESIYSYTNEYGTGKIHYYMNVRTGKVSYYDAKMKISAPKLIRSRLKNTVTDKDGFWIVDLDENLIPIGVRK
ncbi:hypothetical protein [Clostridium felsineum]|uniref:LXG domain-containing protein n=1 Tax=Clostridium felsineum TaxID=36839 RepID=A0A9Q8XEZ1_9CLOT|nr:hypothetical protein [Clostridium felsineum]URZ07897.1 hypothetical protein CLROS_032590 [Clostridium felsineum]URZ12928.1 hypothetical protein CROST_036740 [Clostridium felsineum]